MTDRAVYKTVKGIDLRLELFHPSDDTPALRPAVLIIHGGGWHIGGPEKYHNMAREFTDAGFTAACMQYRLLADGHSVFDAVEDARDAFNYLLAHAEDLHIDPERIVVFGSSAGGHLAAMLPLGKPTIAPAAFVLMNPVLDTSPEGFGHEEIGEKWKDISPLHQSVDALPPTLIFHGTNDGTVPFAGAAAFTEAARAAGKTCELHPQEGAGHNYWWDPKVYAFMMDRVHDLAIRHHILSSDSKPLNKVESS